MLQSIIKEIISEYGEIHYLANELGYDYGDMDDFDSRLSIIINDPNLGLDEANNSSELKNKKFLISICKHLGIPHLLVLTVISEVMEGKPKTDFEPYIYLERNIQLDGYTELLLSQDKRNTFLKVDKSISALALNEHLDLIGELIQTHQKTQQYLFGKVDSYIYYYKLDIAIVFSTSGELLDVVTEYPTVKRCSKATKKRRFTRDFKFEETSLIVEQKYTDLEACRTLDVGEILLRQWVTQLQEEQRSNTPKSVALTPEQQRIQKLETSIRRLELEKSILRLQLS